MAENHDFDKYKDFCAASEDAAGMVKLLSSKEDFIGFCAAIGKEFDKDGSESLDEGEFCAFGEAAFKKLELPGYDKEGCIKVFNENKGEDGTVHFE